MVVDGELTDIQRKLGLLQQRSTIFAPDPDVDSSTPYFNMELFEVFIENRPDLFLARQTAFLGR